ncbi:hypothetical protein ACWEPR_25685 [Streptomyces sp. NPDC004290]
MSLLAADIPPTVLAGIVGSIVTLGGVLFVLRVNNRKADTTEQRKQCEKFLSLANGAKEVIGEYHRSFDPAEKQELQGQYKKILQELEMNLAGIDLTVSSEVRGAASETTRQLRRYTRDRSDTPFGAIRSFEFCARKKYGIDGKKWY